MNIDKIMEFYKQKEIEYRKYTLDYDALIAAYMRGNYEASIIFESEKIKINFKEFKSIIKKPDFFNISNSAFIDEVLGLKNYEVTSLYPAKPLNETSVTKENTWTRIKFNALNTDYFKYNKLLNKLKILKGKTIVDMGCAHGRLGLMIGNTYKDINYIGYEFWLDRIQQAIDITKEEKFNNVKYIHQDLTDKNLQLDGDVFFLYYPNEDHEIMQVFVDKITEVSKRKKILIVTRNSFYVKHSFIKLDQVDDFTIYGASPALTNAVIDLLHKE